MAASSCRSAAVVAVLLLAGAVAGCSSTGPAEASPASPEQDAVRDGPGRTSRAGGRPGVEDDRVQATLAESRGGLAGPGEVPFQAMVPPGGAGGVTFRVEVTPLAAPQLDGVAGAGCQTYGWFTSVTVSGVSGECADLEAGAHDLALILNEPVASYWVTLSGLVEPPPASAANATAAGNATRVAAD